MKQKKKDFKEIMQNLIGDKDQDAQTTQTENIKIEQTI